MLRYSREDLCEFLGEVAPMLWDHWREVATNKDKIELDPQWSTYLALEKLGLFKAYIIRDEADNVVGYSWYFLNPHIHYKRTKVATNDIIYFKPEFRKGFAAIKFLKFCEKSLKEEGAQKITYHVKTAHNFGPVLERMGFHNAEANYEKYIGE